ncbi:DNA/RNA non-specific endonuclease [Treponema sp.]|uniref:DNA/RNA non-specific endonuclease n=1 Tax=Treponema sp. TaxID=166 RepID=UPI00388FA587
MDSKEIPSDFYAELNAIPVCNGNDNDPDNDSDHEIHTYSGFTLCYRESYEDAEWAAYILTREELKAVTGRSNDFRPDPSITTGSSDLSDYKKSGYDRGHLAPAADMEWSKESCSESFFMSNMTPQAPAFNRGMWQQLESQVRRWADRFGKIIVVTGPILEKDADGYAKIGGNQVAVPEYFFKSILAQSEDGTATAISFIMPNSKCEGTLWDYCVTADEIESRTGFDIFSFLPDSEEEKIESSVNIEMWK